MVSIVFRLISMFFYKGAEGGDGGGEIVAYGTPKDISLSPKSYTGKYLKPYLGEGKKEHLESREKVKKTPSSRGA